MGKCKYIFIFSLNMFCDLVAVLMLSELPFGLTASMTLDLLQDCGEKKRACLA